MNNNLDVDLAQLLTVILLISVTFVSFYQTSFNQTPLRNILAQAVIAIFPILHGIEQWITLLMFGIFAAGGAVLYKIGGEDKIKLMGLFAIFFFAISALPYSQVSWFSIGQVQTTLLGVPAVILTATCGITLVFCLFLSNSSLRIKETRKELLSRGGHASEVSATVSGSFQYAVIVAASSAFLSIAALLLLYFLRPVGAALIMSKSYTPLIFGVTGIAIMTILVYYYLVKIAKRE